MTSQCVEAHEPQKPLGVSVWNYVASQRDNEKSCKQCHQKLFSLFLSSAEDTWCALLPPAILENAFWQLDAHLKDKERTFWSSKKHSAI